MFNFMYFDSNCFINKIFLFYRLSTSRKVYYVYFNPIALFMSIGYEYFSEFIENKIQIKSRYIELSMIGIYILLFVICYSSYIAVCFGSTII